MNEISLWAAVWLTMLTGGLAVSYGPDIPPGATTIALAGALYLVVVIVSRLIKPATS